MANKEKYREPAGMMYDPILTVEAFASLPELKRTESTSKDGQRKESKLASKEVLSTEISENMIINAKDGDEKTNKQNENENIK